MIFFVGYYGFGNVGDEAILSSMLAQFRARQPDLQMVVASGNAAKTAEMYGVEAIAWNDIAAIHATVQASDLVVIGGGGLFHDYWGVDPDNFLTPRHWGVTYYAGPALLAALYRKPVMLYAVGIGPLYSGHGIKFTRLAAQAAHVITVRDEGSKKALEEMGIASERIRVTADPGFTFQPAASSGLQEALPPGFELRRPVLGVAPRHWSIGVYPEFLERELAATLDLFIKQTGGTVVLIPFQELSGERENDRATAARIFDRMRFQDRAAVLEPGSAGQIYGWISECDLILGMRLHALIFAATAGVPAVALSYDPKVDELSKLLGLDKLSLDVKDVEAADLAPQLVDALGRRDQFREAMQLAQGKLRKAAEENTTLALALLQALPAESGVRLQALELCRGISTDQENRTLTQKVAELAVRCQELENETASLKGSVLHLRTSLTHVQSETAGVRSRLAEESEQRRLAEASAERYAARLREADHQRASLVSELDHFRALMNKTIALYHSQRAWQVMLLFRKMYTLLVRGPRTQFLRWAPGLLFARWGSLAEYDLTFPDVAAAIPDSIRQSWIGGDGRPETAAPEPINETEPGIPPQRDRYDVVILAIIDFDFRFQRPQQIAAEYARRGHRVFWISPTRFLPPDSVQPYEMTALRENLWEIHLRSRQPDIYMGELLPDHIHAMLAALEAFYRDAGISEHALLVQLPFWRRLALQLGTLHGARILYDCMDDWDTFENMGKFNVSEEKQFVRECDVLVVTGAELQNKFRAQGLKPVLARNGADYPFFAKAQPNELLAGTPRPIVGYFGAIADWIDLELVYEVAKSRPQYTFVLIGQVFGRDVSALQALPNVRLLGNKPYADIPAYLHNFDVCIIPFLLNQVTKATDPVKLYEYFSLGKPVVATDMKELGQCGDLIHIGRGADDFARKLDLALAGKDPEMVQRRIDFARANTWSSRVQQLDEAIHNAFPLVSILIVTYNSAAYIGPCLDSLIRNTSYPNFEVILVDNHSTDHSAALLEEYASRDPRMRLFALPENRGFAGANNYAAQQSGGRFLIFLNIDTMVTGGWVGRLLRHVEQDPSIGLICPVTNFAGNEVKINVNYSGWREMERFARSLASRYSGQKRELNIAPLYCALMPRAVWDRVGEMDTRYEIGMFEDDDLSLRVRQAGFGIFTAEDCFIHHFGQGSFSKLPGETYNSIFEANRRRFEEKWKKPWVVHRTRPGVRPPFEEKRFDPAQFAR